MQRIHFHGIPAAAHRYEILVSLRRVQVESRLQARHLHGLAPLVRIPAEATGDYDVQLHVKTDQTVNPIGDVFQTHRFGVTGADVQDVRVRFDESAFDAATGRARRR